MNPDAGYTKAFLSEACVECGEPLGSQLVQREAFIFMKHPDMRNCTIKALKCLYPALLFDLLCVLRKGFYKIDWTRFLLSGEESVFKLIPRKILLKVTDDLGCLVQKMIGMLVFLANLIGPQQTVKVLSCQTEAE
jgi:hypothetical protein